MNQPSPTSHFSSHLPDIQTTPDIRDVELPMVGVSGIKIPVKIREKDSELPPQHTVGIVSMFAGVAKEVKGTHMSRFTEVLNEHTSKNKTFSSSDIIDLTDELMVRLQTDKIRVQVLMDFFRDVYTPVSNIRGVAPYQAGLTVRAQKGKDGPIGYSMATQIKAIGKTLCPCSREISDFDRVTGRGQGAHSQRGNVSLAIFHKETEMIWFEDLIDIAEASVSSPIYPVLKRADERHITMAAYNNPCFVEDVSRNAVVGIRKFCLDRAGILALQVEVINEESIHFHQAHSVVHEILQDGKWVSSYSNLI